MTVPAVYAVARQYPDWQIKILTRSTFSVLFMQAPSNVSVLGIDMRDYQGIKGFVRLLKVVRAVHPTYVADFHNVLRSWLLDIWFFCSGRRVAMFSKERWRRPGLPGYRRGNEEFRPVVLRYFDTLERLGMKVTPPSGALISLKKVPQWLDEYCPSDQLIPIGIAPFARYRNKTYPPELMRRVLGLLHAEGRFRIYLFGGREGFEADAIRRWASECSSVCAPRSNLTLEQELLLMTRLRLMVSMDSANMHLASLAGIPVVSVWGGTTPECGFLGWNQRSENVLKQDLACQPCCVAGSSTCPRGDFACLTELPPHRLFRLILKNAYET